MAPTVQVWSGREIRALRETMRMSIRDFSARLGVSERMISKWEAGSDAIHPRPVNQQALDSVLAESPPDVHARFTELLGIASTTDVAEDDTEATRDTPSNPQAHQVRHPIDGKLRRSLRPELPIWDDDDSVFLPRTIDVSQPRTPIMNVHRRNRPYDTAELGKGRDAARRAHEPPRRLRHLERCIRLCHMGREVAPDQPAVGKGRTRNSPRCLSLGEPATPAVQRP